MEIKNEEGVRKLLHTLLVSNLSNATFDMENEELSAFLNESAYLTTQSLNEISENLNGGVTRKNRAKVRYLVALLPIDSLHNVSNRIHYIIDNQNLTLSEVRDIVRGSSNDIPFEKIQDIGAGLKAGDSMREIAKKVGVSFDTVERIENFLGISEMRRLKLVDAACDAVREGWSVRKFASIVNIPKSTAHLFLVKAKAVLVELGEI